MSKYVIIGKVDCSFCDNAKKLATARKVKFEYLQIPEDISQKEALDMSGRPVSSFPHIFYENNNEKTFVGGFREFTIFLNKNK